MNDQMAAAVEAAFARFALVYGSQALTRMWLGQDVETVKRAWVHELRGYTVTDVLYAMDHLSERGIPNLLEFKSLCARRPEGVMLKLKEPKADPEHVKRVVREVNKVRDTLTGYSNATAWQQPLLDRYARGDTRLTKFQKDVCCELLEARAGRLGGV